MNNWAKAVVINIVVILSISSLSWAQANQVQELGMTDEASTASKTLLNYGSDDILKRYEGLPLEFGGLERSPILFDPIAPNSDNMFQPIVERVYPQNSRLHRYKQTELNAMTGKVKKNIEYKSMTFSAVDISNDDEIMYSKMAIHAPIREIQSNFLDNDLLKNRHLDSFQSKRGLAITTLAYLDKTVAAALATVQSQADGNATHELLKQQNIILSRIANPQREFMYDDTDMRFESCMNNFQRPRRLAAGGVLKGDARIWREFQLACEAPNTDCAAMVGYHKCACCAETYYSYIGRLQGSDQNHCGEDIDKNSGARFIDGGANARSPNYASLAEYLFIGNRAVDRDGNGISCLIPSTEGCTDEGEKAIFKFEEMFRWVYGDICYMTRETVTSAVDAAVARRDDLGARPDLRIKHIAPMWSVPQAIKAMRDGPTGEVCISSCPQTMSDVKFGICPALKTLVGIEEREPGGLEAIRAWGGAEVQRLREVFGEASLAGIITPKDIKDIVRIPSKTDRDRWIETFCDSAAETAFRRLHNRMSSIAEDHFAMNRAVSPGQKAEMKQLITRVDNYLTFGNNDARASSDSLLVGLRVKADRQVESERSAIVSGGEAAANTSSAATQILSGFGAGY